LAQDHEKDVHERELNQEKEQEQEGAGSGAGAGACVIVEYIISISYGDRTGAV
jgi:hypothetical protein